MNNSNQQTMLPIFEGLKPSGIKVTISGSISDPSLMPQKVLKLNEFNALEGSGVVAAVQHTTGREDDVIRGITVRVEGLALQSSDKAVPGVAPDGEGLSLPLFDGHRPAHMKVSVTGTISDEANLPSGGLRLRQHLNFLADGTIASVQHTVNKDDEVVRLSKFKVERLQLIESPSSQNSALPQLPIE